MFNGFGLLPKLKENTQWTLKIDSRNNRFSHEAETSGSELEITITF